MPRRRRSASASAAGPINSSPAVGPDGAVYFGSWDGSLYALNRDGSLRWSTATGHPIVFSSPALARDGTVCVGSGPDLLAVDRQGGVKWRVGCLEDDDGSAFVGSSPAIAGDAILFQTGRSSPSVQAQLCAADERGRIRWRFPTQEGGGNGPLVSSPAVGPGRLSKLAF